MFNTGNNKDNFLSTQDHLLMPKKLDILEANLLKTKLELRELKQMSAEAIEAGEDANKRLVEIEQKTYQVQKSFRARKS